MTLLLLLDAEEEAVETGANMHRAINVKEHFSAKGDGVTDDTAAIQAALDASVTGESVFLPPGTYLISSLLDTTEPGGKFYSDGDATILASTGAAECLRIRDSGWTIEGIIFDGGDVVSSGINIIDNVTDTRILDCEVRNVQTATGTIQGILFGDGNHRTTIEGCYIHDVNSLDGSASRGIRANAGTATTTVHGVKLIGNTISDITPVADGDGIVVQGWTVDVDILINGNTLRRCAKRGIKVQSPGCTVTNNDCLMENVGGGADPASAITVQSPNSRVSGNRLAGVCTDSMLSLGLAGGSGISVTGNTITCNTGHGQPSLDGIEIQDNPGLSGLTIDGNQVIGPFVRGIFFEGPCEGAAITNNHFEGITDTVIKTGSETTLEKADDVLIDMNVFINNTGAVLVGDGAQGSTGIVFGESNKTDGDYTQFEALSLAFVSRSGPDISELISFTASDATPSVILGDRFKTANASPTTITNFLGGIDGQLIHVIIDANTTITSNANIALAGGIDFGPVAGGVITLLLDGTVWREQSRRPACHLITLAAAAINPDKVGNQKITVAGNLTLSLTRTLTAADEGKFIQVIVPATAFTVGIPASWDPDGNYTQPSHGDAYAMGFTVLNTDGAGDYLPRFTGLG